jgi:hypothetical protein
MRTNIMPPYRPSKSARHESSAQERFSERKSEEKQVERLLALLAKKLGPSVVQGTSRLAQNVGQNPLQHFTILRIH